MQILHRKRKDEFIDIELVRLWQDGSGVQIALTPDGDYITLDGELVADPRLFSIMPNEERKKAEAWWRREQDRKEAEAKAEAESKSPEPEPSQDEQVEPEENTVATDISTALNAIQQQQQDFFKALASTLSNKTPTSASIASEMPNLKVLYSCQKGKGPIVKSPRNWNELGFEEEPEWWGKEALYSEIDDKGARYTYKRYFVPDEGDE